MLKQNLPLFFTSELFILPDREQVAGIQSPAMVDFFTYLNSNGVNACIFIYDDPKFFLPNKKLIANAYGVGVSFKIQAQPKGKILITFIGQERVQVLEVHKKNNFLYGDFKSAEKKSNNNLLSLVKKTDIEFNKYTGFSSFAMKFGTENSLSAIMSSYFYFLAAHFLENDNNRRANQILFLKLNTFNDQFKFLVDLKNKQEKLNKKSSTGRSQKSTIFENDIKNMKDRLADFDPARDDINNFRQRLASNPFPEYVKTKIAKELDRLDALPPISSEAGIIRTYIEWMIDLPWWQQTSAELNLKDVAAELEKNHFGLVKTKKRIIEFVASWLFTKQRENLGQIICLVGPPGVGKTSLGTSIAKAIKRNFVRISLGGVRDEAEIRGHRRTYIGALPGKIIQAINKSGVNNPVLLIDEIDKLSSDFRGDPSSAMLEVLDPAQNSTFTDHFIEEAFDLSNVVFIATANYEWNIPHALYDRMEMIYLSSYTEMEKLRIAEKHLLPSLIKKLKFKKNQLIFTSDAILYMIKHYTREAGVRELERLLMRISRMVIVKILKGKITKEKIEVKQVETYLDQPMYQHTKKEDKSQVGVVTGLAYTSFGGDILPIEATMFEGKNNLLLTGKLGEVMKESATIALDYIKSNFVKFGIKTDILENMDIHIHVPEGATPKDGPSAGVTLTTTLISLFSGVAVPNLLGMTGEITLHGKILPIGGLKEKSIAAARSGLTEIFIPKENEKDIIDIPKEVRKSLKIMTAENYDDIFKYLFPDLKKAGEKALAKQSKDIEKAKSKIKKVVKSKKVTSKKSS